jgi:putative iron-regulated protein
LIALKFSTLFRQLQHHLWKSGETLALLLMAGCSGNQDAANAQHSREPTADKAPASTPTKTDVVSHYADLAHATFQDAVTTAEVLGEVVDARLWPVC